MTKARTDFPSIKSEPEGETALSVQFGPYRLDDKNARLWRGARAIRLTGKAFAMLRYLASRPQELVTKRELLRAVWPDSIVSPATLTSSIKELRKALADDARSPQYIETVHRRGYRFLGQVVSSQHAVVSSPTLLTQSSALSPQPSLLVGREAELAQLHEWFAKALREERQIVLVNGEAGIGKTTLVEAFLSDIGQRATGNGQQVKATDTLSLAPSLWIGRGRCIEQHGAGEPYMPVFEALGRLCRSAEKEEMLTLLYRHAPTWLMHMPGLLADEERESLQRQVGGTTRERMLGEMAEALEALSADRPFLFCLEDLQWSDYSTLDLLAVVASRSDPARLLVLVTCRPLETLASDHPLKAFHARLSRSGRYHELAPSFLSVNAIEQYLARRFADRELPAGVGQLVHHHSEGNPLFMVNIADDLEQQGVFDDPDGKRVRQLLQGASLDAPEGLRQLIVRHFEQMSAEEQNMLMAASVAGVEFSVAAVAAALQMEDEAAEVQCVNLARHRQFLRESGTVEWPDGTFGTHYGFLHTLYQNVLYEQTPPGRRATLHLRIGERLELAYQGRLGEAAAELGAHFEHGRDYRRAVQYLGQAAQHALWTYAYQEAIDHLHKGLALLSRFPQSPERAQQELSLRLGQSLSLMHTRGFAAPEVERSYEQVRDLVRVVGDSSQRFAALWGLRNFHLLRGELQAGRTAAQEFLEQVQRTEMSSLATEAHLGLGAPLFHLGELEAARSHLEESLPLYNPHLPQPKVFLTGQDPRASSLAHLAVLLWLLGYPDQAQERSRQALDVARNTGFSYGQALTLNLTATLNLCCRDFPTVARQAEDARGFAQECGFVHLVATGMALQGWALAMQGKSEEGIALILSGLQRQLAMGIGIGLVSSQMLLVDAYTEAGRIEEARQSLADAFASGAKTGERTFAPELYRLQGRLTLKATVDGRPLTVVEEEAEVCFLKAIAVARRQNAKSLELRAMIDLARLWRQQNSQRTTHDRRREIYSQLFAVYDWFTEGFDTADLRDAESLLTKLERDS